ncbi:hypothetical protein GBP12_01755 [Pediococcus acidilactici]|nr:hypothetical protein GBP12_01755 [Pediococcus acidilactici]
MAAVTPSFMTGDATSKSWIVKKEKIITNKLRAIVVNLFIMFLLTIYCYKKIGISGFSESSYFDFRLVLDIKDSYPY